MGAVSALKKFLSLLAPKKKKPSFTSAVIVAGGSSSRMGNGVSKQLMEICGVPAVVRSLLAFERTPEIKEVIVVAKSDELSLYEGFKKTYNLTKLKKAVSGGDTRQRSVEKGVAVISEKSNYVAIHDAARCLITPEEISAVCAQAYVYDAATAATKAVDTVKLANASSFIESTPDRNYVWNAQTPQIFLADLYRAAVAVANRDGVTATDDCSLVENIEHPIKLVECSRDNIKITTPGDLTFAVSIIKARAKAKEKQK